VPLLTLKFNYQAKKEARERESMRPNGFIFTCVRANSFCTVNTHIPSGPVYHQLMVKVGKSQEKISIFFLILNFCCETKL